MSISANFNAAASSILAGSKASNDMIAAAPKDQQPFLRAQEQMQREAKLVELISNSMKKIEQMQSAIVGNMRG
ncbi:hypothetical protein SAMN05443572_108148 [Myxococcus fulvus]|uniref:Uncharacterized protein n=1 Tax=Myxococcus fulvus TaxID=33 RepID=A0A511T5C8_MYXFU|nr:MULTISPECIES: hypothetical protein [Myxococcus]AKF85748.1 hypothetical protein MFUL124B02_15585 [Myxococcus fulvus 124B02]MCK8496186.1 hypothetical protein [Myxococcus fulvus]GEN08813.1 hypothetical protein MFU01_38500 [Myxococcus fulvus]SEU29229.1 hypothetical protein SAMN05443572_108148 [Myxococcus fulvus]